MAQYVADMTADMRKTVGPFRPAAPSQAREAIKLDVYLHSADESTKVTPVSAGQIRAAALFAANWLIARGAPGNPACSWRRRW